jgi:hypothetical protein
MFFPYFRGKLFEIQAVEAVAPQLVTAGNVLPIIEPVANNWNRLRLALEANLMVGVITNPQIGYYSKPRPREQRVQQPMPLKASRVFANPNAIWGFIIDAKTKADEVNAFVADCPRRKMFIVMSAPTAAGMDDPIPPAVASNPDYLVVNHRAVTPSMPATVSVDLTNAFTAQQANLYYPPDEFYTNRHMTIAADAEYDHFGDYSMVGTAFRQGSGRNANNVALHHIYTTGPKPSNLRIKHYVSRALPSVEAMWMDALTQLVNDLPNLSALSPLNDTATVTDYVALHKSEAFPNLGKMKELAIRHHLLLMTMVQ